mmetsp:Transcript_7848/g.20409  ORF Transcript_7848/g.20409 Transcript_7848/m.20409 type:complete len:144 (-) Transcript_7848:40-471(-)
MRRQSDPTSGFKWRKDAEEEEEEEEGEDPPKEALSSSGIIPSYPKTTEAAREYFTSMSYESKDYVEKALGKKLSTHGMLLRGRPKPRPILGERASPEPLLESIPLVGATCTITYMHASVEVPRYLVKRRSEPAQSCFFFVLRW